MSFSPWVPGGKVSSLIRRGQKRALGLPPRQGEPRHRGGSAGGLCVGEHHGSRERSNRRFQGGAGQDRAWDSQWGHMGPGMGRKVLEGTRSKAAGEGMDETGIGEMERGKAERGE